MSFLSSWMAPVVYTRGSTVYVENIDKSRLWQYMHRIYGTTTFIGKFFHSKSAWSRRLSCDLFFVPELLYILEEANAETHKFSKVIAEVKKNTWIKDANVDVPTKVDMNTVMSFPRKPLPHQLEFIKNVYTQYRDAYQLKGYLLAFGMGLGKGTTSILLAEGLHKKHIIVVAPKAVSVNVWPVEIEDTVGDTTVWTTKNRFEEISKKTKYIVLNYEAVDKIIPYVRNFKSADTMIIVDECHNYKDIDSQRTKSLINLAEATRCEDILLMSGTPVKALSRECMPIFKLLDRFYNDKVQEELKEFSRYTNIINRLMHHRLGMVMHRKLKEEVLELPQKYENDLKLSVPGGEAYTLDAVKVALTKYYDSRYEFYKKDYEKYEQQFFDVLKYVEDNILQPEDMEEFNQYKKDIKEIHSWDVGNKTPQFSFTPEMSALIQKVNKYEKFFIYPQLPNDLKKVFKNCKTIYKYLTLKVMGEVLGNELNRLRVEMTSKLIDKRIVDIINNAEKKTILFSSYTDSIEIAEKVCRKYGLKPIVIDGSNSGDAKKLVSEFKQDESLNPLIASIKVMSTGHTINEANTVIFLNVPFRSTDYDQASERCYRIGQDTDVYIYKLILDTGEKHNLSTRMQDILSWSKEQFGQIVDGEFDQDADVANFMQAIEHPTDGLFDYMKSVVSKIRSLI